MTKEVVSLSYHKGFKYLASLGVDTNGIIASYTNRQTSRAVSKYFDGHLYDAIKPMLASNPKVAEQVRKAIKDEKITKQFCDHSKLYEQAERFTDPASFTKSMYNVDTYREAWKILRSLLPEPTGQLRPLIIDKDSDIESIFSNPEASSGIIAYPQHKREAKDRIKEVALHIMEEYDQDFSLPAIALTRSQITDFMNDKGEIDSSNINYKTRLVMCVDAATVLVEQRVGQPILDYVMKSCSQYAGGKDDNAIQRILLTNCKGKRWISLDYSKFDASIQPWLIYDIFRFLSEYYPASEKKAFEWIAHNFVNMQLLMPDGSMINLHKGIKSGSYFTQIVGSLANLLMILTYLVSKFAIRKRKGYLDITPVLMQIESIYSKSPQCYTLMAMGDDNILFTTDEIDVNDLSNYLYHNFHAKVTVDGEKAVDSGLANEYPHFLKRVWKPSGQEREDVEMWVNLLHPERKRSYVGYSPYHILYGYFLTFQGTMKKYCTLTELCKLMNSASGGIDALAQIKLNDLPGSLRSQILSRGVSRETLIRSIKNNLAA